MNADDFRRIALSLEGAEEGSHFGSPDFWVGGRIFATLAAQAQGYGNLMLTPEKQAEFVAEAREVFIPSTADGGGTAQPISSWRRPMKTWCMGHSRRHGNSVWRRTVRRASREVRTGQKRRIDRRNNRSLRGPISSPVGHG